MIIPSFQPSNEIDQSAQITTPDGVWQLLWDFGQSCVVAQLRHSFQPIRIQMQMNGEPVEKSQADITVFDVLESLGYGGDMFQLQLDWIEDSLEGLAMHDASYVAKNIKVSDCSISQFTVH